MSLMEYLQNPGSNPALRQGLLQFGMSLLGQPGGNLLGSISRAGLAGLGGYQAADEQMRQRSMQDQQLAFQKAQQEAWQKAQAQKEADDASQRKALEGAYQPGQWTGANPYTAGYENSMDSGGAVNMTPGQFDMQRYAESLAQAGNPLALQAFNALKKEQKPLMTLGEGASVFDPNTGQVVASNPKTPKEDAFIALMRQSGIDPESPHGRALLAQRLAKETTHAPAATAVSYSSPMPAMNPKTGEVELVRPDNKGGMTFTGISPPPQNRDVKLPAELQRMQIAGDTMVELLDRYEGLLRKHNPRDPVTQMNPTVRAEIQSVKRNLELQFKELQALGALAGPDIEIMRQALSDPFSVQGAYFGSEGLLAQTKQARDLVRMRSAAVLKSQGKPDAGKAANADPLGLR